jgi:hypothetical protein
MSDLSANSSHDHAKKIGEIFRLGSPNGQPRRLRPMEWGAKPGTGSCEEIELWLGWRTCDFFCRHHHKLEVAAPFAVFERTCPELVEGAGNLTWLYPHLVEIKIRTGLIPISR